MGARISACVVHETIITQFHCLSSGDVTSFLLINVHMKPDKKHDRRSMGHPPKAGHIDKIECQEINQHGCATLAHQH